MTQPQMSAVPTVTLPKMNTAAGATVSNISVLALSAALPALLFFAMRVVTNPVFWSANNALVLPELFFIAVTMTAAVMGLIGLPRFASQVMRGDVKGDTRVGQEMWVGLAFMAAFTQIGYAMLVSAINCG